MEATITETKPKIRHKRKLEQIREERNGRQSDRGYSSSGIEENGYALGTDEGSDRSVGVGEEGTTSEPGTVGRSDSGTGSANNEVSNDHSGASETGSEPTPTATVKDMEAERERKRELARQRKQRQRDRERTDKEPISSSNVGRDGDKSDEKQATFQLKGPFAKSQSHEDVKVFTQKEAEESLQKLVFVYQRGSEILDDILEIVVKDHEKVQIWALSDDEALMFATMQMERAKKDKAAAKTVRTLINIYDRMYLFMIVGPRVIATGQHVKRHGGISFR